MLMVFVSEGVLFNKVGIVQYYYQVFFYFFLSVFAVFWYSLKYSGNITFLFFFWTIAIQ